MRGALPFVAVCCWADSVVPKKNTNDRLAILLKEKRPASEVIEELFLATS